MSGCFHAFILGILQFYYNMPRNEFIFIYLATDSPCFLNLKITIYYQFYYIFM